MTNGDRVRCAIYTRKSTEKGLEQDFNSLDAQREACEAYVASQRHEGWSALSEHYSDPGFSGGNIDRPGLQKLMRDVERGRVDCVVFYKLDRLSRSLTDFVKLAEFFERNSVTFVSITQQFSSTTAMGRLTLNILLSFAEFERAIITERVRDKIAAAKKKGKYLGGTPTFGYDVDYFVSKLVVSPVEAKIVRRIFKRFTETGSCLGIAKELNADGITTKSWTTKNGSFHQGGPWSTQHVYRALNNRTYLGETVHNGESYAGEHDAIVPKPLWDKVQRIFADGTSRKRNQETHEVKALLRGMIRCGHCGRSMICSYTKKKSRVYRYYVCNGAMRYGYSSCPVRSVPAGEVETAVMGQLRALLSSPEMIAQTFRAAKGLQAQETETRCEDKSIPEMLMEASASESAFSEQDIADALRRLDPVWDELFPSEQYRIFRALVESVIVSEDGIDMRLRADGIHSVAAELKHEDERALAV